MKPPAFVRALPRRAFSRFMGQLGRLPAPGVLLTPLLRAYARIYGANLGEAARPVGAYRTFLEFFTRQLKPGSRPLAADPRAILSPADGRVQSTGTIQRATLLQVKGVRYRIADLLADVAAGEEFEGGSYIVVYLAPGDYHRFHWPLCAEFERLVHVPGDLWPVNERAVQSLPGLFARNERVVLRGKTQAGEPIAFVAIGALNVGSIRLAFSRLRTNRRGPGRVREWRLPPAKGRRGEELGHFEFGSSIALLIGPRAGRLDPLPANAPLRMGQMIGVQAGDQDTRTSTLA